VGAVMTDQRMCWMSQQLLAVAVCTEVHNPASPYSRPSLPVTIYDPDVLPAAGSERWAPASSG
jgi:hypothetical protein